MSSNRTFVHPTAVIDPPAKIGTGTHIWHFSHLMPGCTIGDNCMLGQNTFVGGAVEIGNGVRIQNNVSVYDGVTIEDDVFVGPSVVFTNVRNPRADRRQSDNYLPTRIRKGATIGANATIVCGVTIGKYAFIGAGAVITRDVPPHALMFGVPATQRGRVCHCGEKLASGATCSMCHWSDRLTTE